MRVLGHHVYVGTLKNLKRVLGLRLELYVAVSCPNVAEGGPGNSFNYRVTYQPLECICMHKLMSGCGTPASPL